MPIRAVGFDSGGSPGVTQQAYAAWTRWRKSEKRVRLIGKISGRDAWTVLPTKGAKTLEAPKLIVNYPDTGRQANKVAARGAVPVAQFNPNSFKDDLMGQLQGAEPGNWYVHFPYDLRSPEEPHVWFEQLTSETRQKNGRWEKLVSGRRNEALDQLVGTHVVAHLHGLSKIDWEKPPSWAAPWDTNTSILSGPGSPQPIDPAPVGASPKQKSSAVLKYR
ncbi:terminase gpA endonuclease subunit [Burkholderia sp. BC1]